MAWYRGRCSFATTGAEGVGTVFSPTFNNVVAMARNPTDSKIHVLESADGGRLYEIDEATGGGTLKGGGELGGIISMAETSTTLYGLGETGVLYSINPANGTPTTVGVVPKFRDILAHPSDGALLIGIEATYPHALWSVNPATMATSPYYPSGIGKYLAATSPIGASLVLWFDSAGVGHTYDGVSAADLGVPAIKDVVVACFNGSAELVLMVRK